MLVKLEMLIEAEGLHSNMGSLFHGYLLESMDSAYAEYFHINTTNAFTSCVYRDHKTKNFYWRITAYNQKVYEMLNTCWPNGIPDSIYLKHKDLKVLIKSFSCEKKSYEELFLEPVERKKIRLITPTSFKSQGMTHIFPNISTLLSGVISKINQHSESIELGDKKMIDSLLEKVYIKNYHLKTQLFYLENIKIKGFLGELEIGVRGEDKGLLHLLHFLILMSEYTGLGIKTALGMGGVRIEK